MANKTAANAPRNLRRDSARNRERMLDAARDAVIHGSPLQLNEIARAAEVGVGTVYRHFPSTEALVEAVVLQHFHQLLEHAQRGARQSDPWLRLETFLRRALQLQVDNAGFAAVVASQNNVLPETIAVKAELGGVFHRLLTAAIDGGCIRKGIKAQDIIALVCGLVYSIQLAEGPRRARVLELYLGVLLAGIQPE
jgi:AcrR family transcriptional regulator